MTLFGIIPLKRFLLFWIPSFVILYIASFLFYVFISITGNVMLTISAQLLPPILYMIAAWLYFRGVARNDWTSRTVTAVVWIGLSLVISFALMGVVYGVSWTSSLNQGLLVGQGIDFIAILVGAYLGKQKVDSRQ